MKILFETTMKLANHIGASVFVLIWVWCLSEATSGGDPDDDQISPRNFKWLRQVESEEAEESSVDNTITPRGVQCGR